MTPQSSTAAAYVPMTRVCPRCGGSGRFMTRRGADGGECFACGGDGYIVSEAARRAAEIDAAPKVKSDALLAAFATARANGLKRPRIHLGGIVISEAPATGKNAGALYVKDDGAYLGKIVGSAFLSSRDCTAGAAEKVQGLLADPLAQAVATGKETGRCCMCGLELSDPESVAAGIGPICAKRWGF